MKKYERPVVFVNEELAEGVYAAPSGFPGEGCYTVKAAIIQSPELGHDRYCIQLDAEHDASHHAGAQYLVIKFNQPVANATSNGTVRKGNGTSELHIVYSYHANDTEKHGLGHLYLTSEPGLAIEGTPVLYCNEDCFQH